MPDEFSPDLGGLESDYRIQTELRRSRWSRTYLARHLGLNRDVTVQVLGAPRNESDNSLTLFASDARTLSVIRHSNVVPVLDARWLAGGTFAVVRPRVRGLVVDEVVSVEGPLAASHVARALEQISSAVAWARDNGIVHRGLSGASVRFQQGSGRVLVEMEFLPLGTGGGVPDACDDARTIGRLAFEMLSGRRQDDATGGPLAELRTDLPEHAIRELSTLMNCDRRAAAPAPNGLIASLAAVPDSSFVTRKTSREAPARAIDEAPLPRPADAPDKGRMGFGARLVILAVISTAVGAAGALIYRREPSETTSTTSANVQTTSAGGEVVRRKAVVKRDTNPPGSTQAPAPTSAPPPPPPRVEPPTKRRHEPLRGAPPAKLPAVTTPSSADPSKPSDTATAPGAASVVDVCESADAEDQHACLVSSIDRGDKVMNAVYARLVAALRRQAKTPITDPDPATVTQLRQAQRDWLGARDAECRGVGDAPLYAHERAQCYAEEADKRTRDLQRMIESLG